MTDAKDDALTAAYMAGKEEGKETERRKNDKLIRQLMDALTRYAELMPLDDNDDDYQFTKKQGRAALAAAKDAGY